MAVLSPIMSFIVDKEMGFPAPSEKEKINKVIKRYRNILSYNSKRSDAPELMFGIADLLMGRGEPGDYREAARIYDQILTRLAPDSLRARALVGKAELLIGKADEAENALSLCEKARKLLHNDLEDFFVCKTIIVEAEILMARNKKNDWEKAIKLVDQLIRSKHSHWYFKGRALLVKAEITLYKFPKKIKEVNVLCDKAIKELISRPDDYFTNKARILKSETIVQRGIGGDKQRAEKLLNEVISAGSGYKDLVARAKLDLADIVKTPKANKLVQEVFEMEELDPYLVDKARLVEKAIKDRKK